MRTALIKPKWTIRGKTTATTPPAGYFGRNDIKQDGPDFASGKNNRMKGAYLWEQFESG
jgi:hypothetical protein